MNTNRSPGQVFDDEFPSARANVLELAAVLDRVDRAEGEPPDNQNLVRLQRAIETLLRCERDRAEQVQLIFSRPFKDDWRQEMDV